jgi:hypothetical protein
MPILPPPPPFLHTYIWKMRGGNHNDNAHF